MQGYYAGAMLVEQNLDEILALCAEAQHIYVESSHVMRRLLNQAVFAKLLVTEDAITGAELASPYAEVFAEVSGQSVLAVDTDGLGSSEGSHPDQQDHGVNIQLFVGVTGFEPVASAL